MRVLEIIIGVGITLGVIVALLAHLGYGIVKDAEHRRRLGRRDRALRRARRAGRSDIA